MRKVVMLTLLGLLIAACSCSRRPAADAVTIEYDRRFPGGVACRERMLVAGERMRVESCQTEPMSVLLFDPRRAGTVQLFPAAKEYRVHGARSSSADEPPPRSASEPADRFAAPRGQLRRLILEGALQYEEPTLLDTNVDERVAGYPCRVYRVAFSQRVTAEVCLASWDDAPVPEHAMPPFDRRVALPGFALSSVSFAPDGSESGRTTVVAVHHGPLPDALFEIPADYREAPAP